MKLLFFLLLFIPAFSFSQIDHWETALYADGIWKYFPGNEEPPNDWTDLNFNDNNWPEGMGGIGYGDGDDNTLISPVASLYIRQKFSVVDFSKIEMAVFNADYDDAFVAYINGVEIARANVEGNPPAHDTDAADWHEAVLYEGGEPDYFVLEKTVLENLINGGENILSVQIHNKEGTASSDLTSLFWFSFAINDGSNNYGPVPNWFEPPVFVSPLPIVKINTGGEYIPNEPKIPGTVEVVWNGPGEMNNSAEIGNELNVDMEIERRGQSSLVLFPKNNFEFETKDNFGEDMDVSFLNFPLEEDWILHGPYSDKTLMRNVLTMELARNLGQYASRTRFVELIINGNYEGIYVVMEKIKRDVNRVDVAKVTEDDVEGDELTGGYIFKIDKDEADWFSQYDISDIPGTKLPFQYVSPKRDDILPVQEEYIQTYIDHFENALKSPSLFFNGMRYNEYIDVNSFAEHFILTELSRNVDGYRLSTYFHKKKESNGGKIFSGPIWDYNIAWANADYCGSPSVEGWMYSEPTCFGSPFWWDVMMEDELFINAIKCRWETAREGPLLMDSIFAFIDEKTDLLGPAIERNFERWPILDEYIWPNSGVYGDYETEIEVLKNWIAGRLAWMDDNMPGECLVLADENISPNNKIKIWPNPASEKITLEFPKNINGKINLRLFDTFGKTLVSRQNISAENKVEIDVSQFAPGNYFLMAFSEKGIWTGKVVIGDW